MFAGTRDSLKRLAGTTVSRFLNILNEHFSNANDSVQWRAQFMAHVGQEPAFGDRRLHSRIARISQAVD